MNYKDVKNILNERKKKKEQFYFSSGLIFVLLKEPGSVKTSDRVRSVFVFPQHNRGVQLLCLPPETLPSSRPSHRWSVCHDGADLWWCCFVWADWVQSGRKCLCWVCICSPAQPLHIKHFPKSWNEWKQSIKNITTFSREDVTQRKLLYTLCLCWISSKRGNLL